MNVFVKVAISAKTNKRYVALVGYKDGICYTLSFDKYTIMNVLNVSPYELSRLEVGEYEV